MSDQTTTIVTNHADTLEDALASLERGRGLVRAAGIIALRPQEILLDPGALQAVLDAATHYLEEACQLAGALASSAAQQREPTAA